MNYSCLKASTGLILAALLAGYIPPMIPVTTATIMPPSKTSGAIISAMLTIINLEITVLAIILMATPPKTPSMPPIKLIVLASTRKRARISLFFAP